MPQPGLAGDFQVGNAAAVLAVLRRLGLEAAADRTLVAAVLPQVQLTGRGQRIEQDGVEWLLDVAHNPAAAAALAGQLGSDAACGATTAIIGMLDDKDVEGVVVPLNRARRPLDRRDGGQSPGRAGRGARAADRQCLRPTLPDRDSLSRGDRIGAARRRQ